MAPMNRGFCSGDQSLWGDGILSNPFWDMNEKSGQATIGKGPLVLTQHWGMLHYEKERRKS